MWKLKLDKDGHVVLQDGKPVYVRESDGKEVAQDVPAMLTKITDLTNESRTHREAKEAAEAKVAEIKDLDIPAAREALKTVANLNDKKLVDAGEVDRVKQAAIDATEAKYKPIVAERDTFKQQLDGHLVGSAFAGSKFIAEKFQAQGPAGVEIARALFGSRFVVKDGKVLGMGSDGKTPLNSLKRPGEFADPEEAIEMMAEGYAHKASILKGVNQSGTGAGNGSGVNSGGKATITRADFAKLPPAEQAKAASEAVIVD